MGSSSDDFTSPEQERRRTRRSAITLIIGTVAALTFIFAFGHRVARYKHQSLVALADKANPEDLPEVTKWAFLQSNSGRGDSRQSTKRVPRRRASPGPRGHRRAMPLRMNPWGAKSQHPWSDLRVGRRSAGLVDQTASVEERLWSQHSWCR